MPALHGSVGSIDAEKRILGMAIWLDNKGVTMSEERNSVGEMKVVIGECKHLRTYPFHNMTNGERAATVWIVGPNFPPLNLKPQAERVQKLKRIGGKRYFPSCTKLQMMTLVSGMAVCSVECMKL